MEINMPFSTLWEYGLLPHFFTIHKTVTTAGLILTIAAYLLCIAVPYLLGSINVSILLSSHIYKDDIRRHGSGNAGMTNIMRTYGKKMAAVTFGGDFLKAVIASLFGRLVLGYYGALLAGLFCFLGHIFPCFYRFKGGKGVVTACAMILMTDWRVFLILFAVFVIIVAVTKYVSLGSVVGMLLYPIILDRFGRQGWSVLIAFLMAVMCAFVHRSNIKRIMNGTENKLSFKSKKGADEDSEDRKADE
ncbi:MAG: glycerol-3-phosphate 1-O-acyltransferase PlsY [Clostridiales bacterium]|nr:glycerol-3-phosphate 1-O-acyltransferase PlsY [Clostridiales bacterium]